MVAMKDAILIAFAFLALSPASAPAQESALSSLLGMGRAAASDRGPDAGPPPQAAAWAPRPYVPAVFAPCDGAIASAAAVAPAAFSASEDSAWARLSVMSPAMRRMARWARRLRRLAPSRRRAGKAVKSGKSGRRRAPQAVPEAPDASSLSLMDPLLIVDLDQLNRDGVRR